jgi:hypothetical protein
MIVLAELTTNGDLSTAVGQAIFFLILSGVALFVLKIAVLGDNPVATSSIPRKRVILQHYLFGVTSQTEGLAGSLSQSILTRSPPSERGREKRRSLRRRGNPVPILISDALNPGKPLQGLILDRSRGGLFLSVPQRIAVGSLLAVRTPDFPGAVPSVGLRVRHCKQKGEDWRIGCQFTEELPWSVLLLFG